MYFLKILARSWLDSLSFFLPRNFAQNIFFLWRGLRELFFSLRYLWIYGLAFILLFVLPLILIEAEVIKLGTWGAIVYSVLIFWFTLVGFFLFFTNWFCSAYRPSIDIKNRNYYLNQAYAFSILFPIFFVFLFTEIFVNEILFFLILLIISYIPLLIEYYNEKLSYLVDYTIFIFFLIMILYFLRINLVELLFHIENFLNFLKYFYLFSPFIIFVILFLLDSQRSEIAQLKALGRAFLMYLYNLPFCVIMGLVFYFISYLIWPLFTLFGMTVGLVELGILSIILLTIFPFYVCILTNYYTKQIHDNFSLYY